MSFTYTEQLVCKKFAAMEDIGFENTSIEGLVQTE
jgi:hypothetical protein